MQNCFLLIKMLLDFSLPLKSIKKKNPITFLYRYVHLRNKQIFLRTEEILINTKKPSFSQAPNIINEKQKNFKRF
jgi:hypothetical protein